MEKRLLLFLQSEDMNPTRFADKIGVQRSSISHILSGRNKPSYDFLLKIMEAFPQLSAEWLLTGRGKMYKADIISQRTLFDQIPEESNDRTIGIADENISNQLINKETEHEINSDNKERIDIIEKEVYKSKQEVRSAYIEKIVIFYSDRSFRDYKPFESTKIE
jgi:transcriptional regulator with XRE-family HTH domain